ncbi:hypothetical protein SO694_00013047 [Aureococcus anophagefferens]|uniref:PNPLA domain-containing protein n=1 Tax=Aureococcus anophagefferens TaxID=44056 RepID=A0ABR1G1R6_AURAN
MVVGLALSGGGVTACVCALCLLDALGPLGPDVVVSTVSGGTLGYLLHVNAPRFKNLTYPETGPNATYESLREARANDGEAWFAQIVREIPDGSRAHAARAARRGRDAPGEGRAAADARRTEVDMRRTAADARRTEEVANARAASPDKENRTAVGTVYGWWEAALDAAALSAYAVEPWALVAGDRAWTAGAALLDTGAAPISRDADGVYGAAAARLRPVDVAMAATPRASTPGLRGANVTLPADFSLMNAASFSSAFWAAAIVESGAEYALLKDELITLPSAAGDDAIVLDGGMVDTTGIAALLRRRATTVVAFYDNNNGGVAAQPASLAYLFGAAGPTDSMNAVAGPDVLAVFDGALWPAALANLTAGTRAALRGVRVAANAYLGVEAYVLDELLVFPLERSPSFLASFADPAVAANVADDWPNAMALSMDPFAANLLCADARWKVGRHRAELAALSPA